LLIHVAVFCPQSKNKFAGENILWLESNLESNVMCSQGQSHLSLPQNWFEKHLWRNLGSFYTYAHGLRRKGYMAKNDYGVFASFKTTESGGHGWAIRILIHEPCLPFPMSIIMSPDWGNIDSPLAGYLCPHQPYTFFSIPNSASNPLYGPFRWGRKFKIITASPYTVGTDLETTSTAYSTSWVYTSMEVAIVKDDLLVPTE
jgi:hypothetical protein